MDAIACASHRYNAAMTGRTWRAAWAFAGALVLLAAGGVLYQQIRTAQDARRFAAPGRMVDIGGRRLHLLCLGSGPPTVIFESSGLGTVLQYQVVMQELAGTQRVCAYDRAGLGWSDPSPRSATANQLESDLVTLLHNADLMGPFIFVASSAGGLTIDLHMRRHPEEVAGVVWVDALSGDMVQPLPELKHVERAACVGYVASWFGIPRMLDALDIANQGGGAAELSAALTYRTQSLKAACSMTRAFAASAEEIRAAPGAPSKIPVAVLVHGIPRGIDPTATRSELDQFEPKWIAAQHALAAQFSGAKFEVIAGSGHLIAMERPDAVVRAIRDMLTRVQSPLEASQ
jgi:pimeloyl-ACP methyl ester carboxylesterase